jgi:16S rRNA (cytosine967-C5)-methyltransferase
VASPARHAALDALRRLERGGETLGDVLAGVAPGLADERDRALLHELVLGTERRRGWLDHVLGRLSDRPFDRLSPAARHALRLGAYQLLFLRVAPHAAVSESVELARTSEPRSTGFVNAVLRRLQREGPPPEPDPAADPLGWLTTVGSLPRWLAERWNAQLGSAAAVARARAFLEPPPTHVRLNPRMQDAADRVAAAGIELVPTSVPGAFRASGGSLGALAEAGVLFVQDRGSQLVAHLAAGDGWQLDACAAPGGKAMLMADIGGPRTRVVAAEASRKRLAVLARLASRWGAEKLSVLAADALHPPFRGGFDGVLLDAPCSGLGTLGRNPDIRWRLTPRDLERHAERQRAMIRSLASLVRPGGRLVYATCSLEAEETDAVVEPFLAANALFEWEELPDWALPFGSQGRVRLDPARDPGDGFFAARLRRVG